MSKGYIFDWDGTAIDSYDRQFKWFTYWAAHSNIDFPYTCDEEFRPIYGKAYKEGGIQGSYDFFNLPCDMSDYSHPIHKIYDEFNSTQPADFFEGVPELLDWLLTTDKKVAICTNNYTSLVQSGLQRIGMNEHIEIIVDGKTIPKYSKDNKENYYRKPSKKMMQRTLKELQLAPQDAIHICDTLVDLQSAVNIPYGNGPNRTGKRFDLVNVGHLGGFEQRDILQGVETVYGRKEFDKVYTCAFDLLKEIKEHNTLYIPKKSA